MRNKMNRSAAARSGNSAPQPQHYSSPLPRETPVTRYIHPIQANPFVQEGPSLPADPLTIILDTLARHSEMLEQLLQRTENNNTDTM